MTTATDYGALMEGVYEVYEKRACDLLGLIGKFCRDAGLETTGPFDFSCDSYEWSLIVSGASCGDVDLTLGVLEEAKVECVDGDTFGVTFYLDAHTSVGEHVVSATPENYTGLWVVDARDPIATAERFATLYDYPLTTIPELIKAYP